MNRWKKVLIVAVIAACVVVAVVFVRTHRSERLNIVLISVDALGAKHMGCYGYSRDTSPNMDTLAREGVLFTRAISQATWTIPSHLSMLSSLYVTTHRIYSKKFGMDPDIVTLAEVLHDHGYVTAAFVDNFYVSARFGFDQGFDLYDDTEGGIEAINDKVSNWLADRSSGPFFLFYHVFDVHCPYAPPKPYFNMYSTDYQGSLELSDLKDCIKLREGRSDFSDADVDYIAANYDAGIRYTDEHLGKLFQMLESLGLSDNTIIMLTSDHGEQLMEHGRIGHAGSLYDEVLHVPLIMRTPHEPEPGRRIGGIVRLIDVAPTLLELVGIKPPPSFQGVSLVPLLRGEETLPMVAIAESMEMRFHKACLYQDEYHFIYTTRPATVELYSLEDDPLEQENLVHKEEALARHMASRLRAILEEAQAAGSHYRVRPLAAPSKDIVERLRALGYAD